MTYDDSCVGQEVAHEAREVRAANQLQDGADVERAKVLFVELKVRGKRQVHMLRVGKGVKKGVNGCKRVENG